jgi:hypothetical protein
MSSATRGLFDKYRVERRDGRPVTWCFVLEDTDPLIGPALVAYAAVAYEAGYQKLCRDLVLKVNSLGELPGQPSMGDQCDRCEHERGQQSITFDGQGLGCFTEDKESADGTGLCPCYGFQPRPEAA